ncbi:MAG TPA: anti-sigma regulatory factor [Mycobacteriales bacterium]
MTENGAPGGPAPKDEVVVRLPAEGAYLSVLRMVTAGLAARLDFTVDEIEDLKIAVDEACAMLLAGAMPGAELNVAFTVGDEVLHVGVTVPTVTGEEPSRDTFSWTVLTALAGDVDSSADADQAVTISLHKRRGQAA